VGCMMPSAEGPLDALVVGARFHMVASAAAKTVVSGGFVAARPG
jgi:hypothetical protein